MATPPFSAYCLKRGWYILVFNWRFQKGAKTLCQRVTRVNVLQRKIYFTQALGSVYSAITYARDWFSGTLPKIACVAVEAKIEMEYKIHPDNGLLISSSFTDNWAWGF